MKVLQINSIYRKGSTGKTTYEVEKALISKGYEACVAYGYGEIYDGDNYLRINTKLSNTLHKIMSRITGLEGYFSVIPTIKLVHFIKKQSPDIIHLRCLHGDYINLPLLFRYLKKYDGQIFMNLHDCWDFTGHCPYFGQCQKWKDQCENCELYKEYPKSIYFDTSKKIYNDKKKWFSNTKKMHVIAVSKWLKDLANESILKNNDISYIYNWIDQTVFNDSYEITTEDSDFTIVFVSASWIPGTYRYETLIKLLKILPKEYKIKIVGIYKGEVINNDNIEYVGYVGDFKKLASIYANANVYIHLSIDEAFGKVIAEANACGIPSIVFNVTGCAEVVSETSGYKVNVGDLNTIIDYVNLIKKNGKSYYKNHCIDNVNTNFNYKINSDKLIEKYEESLK